MAMNPKIKARWVAWLRANVDKQTRGRLHREQEEFNYPAGFCCLGGLCELALADGVVKTFREYDGVISYGNEIEESDVVLPESVKFWAGLRFSDPVVYVASMESSLGLTELNDDLQWDFNQIADIIEQQL